ncbi:hypothetical protein AAX29_01342 [Aliarcobacter thereius]|uniref:Lipoprotein n=1 Tax=Aliarcobacter thereius TaxID=544718 RepID=A0A1C0B6A9_9BACT|nr:hypothetical protein [Aliarcobacter thereius]OCL98832.1 hypothetical protein AAX29_01342 [Aliarcobacter thereius]
MKKNTIIATALTLLLFTGCSDKEKEKYELSSNALGSTYLLDKESGELFYVDNKTKYKVSTESEIKNKIGQVLKLDRVFDYTKIYINTKIYNDRIFYTLNLEYSPIIKEVIDENDPTKKNEVNYSKVNFEEWKKKITNYNSNYSLTLVFRDNDDFTLITKEINLKNISVNFNNGISYEGSFLVDNSIATKINNLSYYYVFPNFN